jgi:apolipoprotein D and lipocalin family protein
MSSVPSTSIPQPPPEPPLPLDERIHRAELRLIAREDRLKRRIDSLGRRLHEVTQPKRFIAPAIGGAFVLFALWMMLRGRVRPLARRAAAMAHAPRMHPHGAVSQMPWVGLLGFAWPLLPGAWRARVNPTTAATVLSVALPLIERALAGSQHRPLPTVVDVDLARYAGTWHEIAHLPAPFEAPRAGPSSVHYALRRDRIDVLNRRRDRNGREHVRRGVARLVPDSGNAKLTVSFAPGWLSWLPFAWTDQWVLHVDDQYQLALVGHPNRRDLRVLSRSPRLQPERLAALIALAAELEFPVEHLRIAQVGS